MKKFSPAALDGQDLSKMAFKILRSREHVLFLGGGGRSKKSPIFGFCEHVILVLSLRLATRITCSVGGREGSKIFEKKHVLGHVASTVKFFAKISPSSARSALIFHFFNVS